MARGGRPKRKATAAEREQVRLLRADGWSKQRIARLLGTDHETLRKLFAEELEHGADMKRAELIAHANKAAKKGNVTAIRWLHDRSETARAAEQMERLARGAPPAETPTAPPPAERETIGKKQERRREASTIATTDSTFATPPPPPRKLH